MAEPTDKIQPDWSKIDEELKDKASEHFSRVFTDDDPDGLLLQTDDCRTDMEQIELVRPAYRDTRPISDPTRDDTRGYKELSTGRLSAVNTYVEAYPAVDEMPSEGVNNVPNYFGKNSTEDK